jgi:acetolactate synthase I/III small subunit
MKHTLVAWMRDKPGVLNRVSGMLRRRNFNIDSLQVSHSETPGISRMTFVVDGDERMVDQVVKQLQKIVDVTRIEEITDKPVVLRELALIRVHTTPETRSEIMQFADVYRAQIVDSVIDLLDNFGIKEMVRTGRVAISRGSSQRAHKRSTAVWKAVAGSNGSSRATREKTSGV